MMSIHQFSNFCVIFDLDGVLADTGPIHFESWANLGQQIGVKVTREFFEKTFGQQSPTITRKLVGPDPDDVLIEEWADLKEIYYREMVRDKLEPLPGVMKILVELKSKGFKLAVGSSGPSENVDLLLTSLKIKQYFDVIISAAEVKKGKPEPDVFLIAAKWLHVKPKNCIVIEDAPVGIEAARRAGMISIALTTTHNKEELVEADLIINDLTEISIEDIVRMFKLN